MKHFIFLIVAVFTVMLLVYLNKDEVSAARSDLGIKVYASKSFLDSWGPGPKLKEIFEKQTGQKISYIEMSDPNLTFQKMNFDGDAAVGDAVVGLDQFDLIRASDKIRWHVVESKLSTPYQKDFKIEKFERYFLPYDWAPIAFVTKNEYSHDLKKLDDLLQVDLKHKIALQDPRTSSPGLQFLYWVMRTKNETEAIEFLKKLAKQAHSFSPSWSTAYGLFKQKQAELVLSYVTSPVYHLVEEKDASYRAIEFQEGHPLQIEFAGVPETCQNCDGAIRFIQFLQSPEAQKIIMTKNYMLPVYKPAQEATAFDTIKMYSVMKGSLPTKEELTRWLNLWSDIRKNSD